MSKPKKRPATEDQDMFSEELLFASTENAPLVENKHQRIIDGACKVFFKKGYHPTTIRDIAKACDMSMGQLYHYIRSKDDVLFLVHRHIHRIWHDYLKRSGLEQLDDDPREKLRQALYHSLEFMIEHRKLIQFVYSESKYLDKKHLKLVLDMTWTNAIGFWRRLLEDVNKQQPVIKGDLDTLSGLVGYVVAFVSLSGWTFEGKPEKKHLDTLVEFSLRGLGIDSASRPTENK
jgi:AcrR family transcriptional regulator